jgi:uncharacterized protein YndB with AHSA1/START domain
MPIKKDGTGKRWVEMEFIAPGTPEQVWRAMATGPGNTAWFTNATIEGRVGGAIRFDFGANGSSTGEVTTWQPPHRFGYVERDWAEGAPPIETEITVVSRSGDRCVLRMVHSLFASTDDWDDQLEGFENGWPAFFAVLRLMLEHFAGHPAASFVALERVGEDVAVAWQRFSEALGVRGAAPGEEVTMLGAERWPLTVERVQQDRRQRWTIVRGSSGGIDGADGRVPGVVMVSAYQMAGKTQVGVTAYFYGEGAVEAAAAAQKRWGDWLTRVAVEPSS